MMIGAMGSAWTRRMALPAVCWLGVAACGLDFDRYDPDAAAGALDGGHDASTEDHAADTAMVDGTGADAAQENTVSACKPVAGVLTSMSSSGPVTIDGDLSDWGSTSFTLLDAADAALIMGPNGTCTPATATSQCLVPNGETAEFAFLRDAANLYLGVRVTVPVVGGGSATNPYTNDAIEIYLPGRPDGDGGLHEPSTTSTSSTGRTSSSTTAPRRPTAVRPTRLGVTSAVKRSRAATTATWSR